MEDKRKVLTCKGVSKRFGKRQIVKDVGFELGEGEVLGLLGPNGAGKTTIMKSIMGLVYPDDGEIEVFGHDVSSAREKALANVGAIIESPVFPGYLTGFENLMYLASLTASTSKARVMETLELVGLKESAHSRVEGYSFGMKQRLGIAQALLPDSKILILDEPTNGLDPHGIAGMRRLVGRLSKEMNVSIIVSSHLIGEMEQVCDKVVIIHHGRKVLDASAAELAKEHETVTLSVRGGEFPSLKAIAGFVSEAPARHGIAERVFKYSLTPEKVPDIVKAAVEAGAQVCAVSHNKLNLESLFLELTSSGEKNVRIDSF